MDKFQDVNIELLKTIEFPTISGRRIATDLLAHQELWSAFTLKYKWRINLGLEPERFWDLWSVIVFTQPSHEDQLKDLVESWHPDFCMFTDLRRKWLPDEEEPFFSFDGSVWEDPKMYIEFWWECRLPIPPNFHPCLPPGWGIARNK